jgi:hypothetical protein
MTLAIAVFMVVLLSTTQSAPGCGPDTLRQQRIVIEPWTAAAAGLSVRTSRVSILKHFRVKNSPSFYQVFDLTSDFFLAQAVHIDGRMQPALREDSSRQA